MKKVSWSVAILMLGITAILVAKLIIIGDSKVDPDTGIISVNVSESNQAHILFEMNEFLEGLELINKSILTEDNSYLKLAAEKKSKEATVSLDFFQY